MSSGLRSSYLNLKTIDRLFLVQISQSPNIIEGEFQLRAADDTFPGENKKRGGSCFDQPLESIPTRLRNFPKFSGWIQNQIENNQWEIGIPQKEVSGFDGIDGLGAANPQQMMQSLVIECLWIERIAPID